MTFNILSSSRINVKDSKSIIKLLIAIGLIFLLTFTKVTAQNLSQDQNYTHSQSILYPVDNESQINNLPYQKKLQTIQYYNGLGKILQSNHYKFSPQSKDLITPIKYDNLGLEPTSYLSYRSGINNGEYRIYALDEQSWFYGNFLNGVVQSDSPFVKIICEKSPLLRTLVQGFAGESWQPSTNHTVRTSYSTNSAADNIILFTVTDGTNGAVINLFGYCNLSALYKTKITDENNVESYVYKNKSGIEILKTTVTASEIVKTYYVYDNFNRLRFIIPPATFDDDEFPFPVPGANQTLDPNNSLRKRWITEFKYDGLNREVEKIMPEEEPVWTIYDPAGRVILRQDGIMRVNNDWLFTKYDRKGRMVMTGIVKLSEDGVDWNTRSSVQDLINEKIGPGKPCKFYEEHTSTTGHGYTDFAFPVFDQSYVADYCIYTINYYDDYDFDNDGNVNITFQNVGFNANDYTDGLYPNYVINGHTPFYRIADNITMRKVRVFGGSGTANAFGSGEYNYNPPSPQFLYYKGDITLKPGWHSYEDQEIHIGPNIVLPPGVTINDEDWLETAYFYDKYGRVIQTNSQNHLDGNELLSTQYDFSGKVIRTIHSHTSEYQQSPINVQERFTYDHAGRLINSFHKINDGNEKLISQNVYNEIGQLITKKLHDADGGFLQTVDYRYNIRGWLKSVNDLSNMGSDLFAFTLHYEDVVGNGLNNTAKYNGNISAMTWSNPYPFTNYAYRFEYDNLNRLTAAFTHLNGPPYPWAQTSQYRENSITYDLNGNIQTLLRNKGGSGNTVDDLNYDYLGNKLIKVEDAISGSTETYEFVNGSNQPVEYDYDFNGNMIEDKNKGIKVEYNYLNLPVRIKSNSDDKLLIEWMYDASGTKLKKTVYDTEGNGQYVQDYVNGFVYKTDFTDALPELSFFSMSEGRIVKSGSSYEYQYFLKDHLGSTRVVFSGNSGQIVERYQYYPFGATVNLQLSGEENDYRYNGKEYEDDHGLNWYHYGARYYDPALGRWHTMDPADEFHSPYLYVGNNPVNFIDPFGMQTIWYDPTGTREVDRVEEGPDVSYIYRNNYNWFDVYPDELINRISDYSGYYFFENQDFKYFGPSTPGWTFGRTVLALFIQENWFYAITSGLSNLSYDPNSPRYEEALNVSVGKSALIQLIGVPMQGIEGTKKTDARVIDGNSYTIAEQNNSKKIDIININASEWQYLSKDLLLKTFRWPGSNSKQIYNSLINLQYKK